MKKQMRWLLYAMNFLAFFAISMVNTQMIPFLSKLGYTVVQRGYIRCKCGCGNRRPVSVWLPVRPFSKG